MRPTGIPNTVSAFILTIAIAATAIFLWCAGRDYEKRQIAPTAEPSWADSHCFATHIVLMPGNWTNVHIEVYADNVRVSGILGETNTVIYAMPGTRCFSATSPTFETTNLLVDFMIMIASPETDGLIDFQ